MSSHQKKIAFLFFMIVVALGINIIPRTGKIITVKDELRAGNESLSLISLESKAAVFPSSDALETNMRIGP